MSDLDTQARQAIVNFKKVLNRQERLARVMARKSDLRLLPNSRGSYTDGKNIHIQVPYSLFKGTPHADRSVCRKRDDDNILLCEACRVVEEVEAYVFHEVSHICFGTFQKVSNSDLKSYLDEVLKCFGDKERENFKSVVHKVKLDIPAKEYKSYYVTTASVSPVHQLLANLNEDVRVNAEMRKERPGSVVPLEAMYNFLIKNGVPRGKETIPYKDLPHDSQMVIGMVARMSGYSYEPFLAEEVCQVLEDEDLNKVFDQIIKANSSRDTGFHAFSLKVELNRLGMFLDEEPEKDESESDDSNDDSSQSSAGGGSDPSQDGEPADGQPGPSGDDSESDASQGGESESDASDPGKSEYPELDAEQMLKILQYTFGHADEIEESEDDFIKVPQSMKNKIEGEESGPSTRTGRGGIKGEIVEAIERAIRQVDFFDSPSENVSGVKVVTRASNEFGWSGLYKSRAPLEVSERILAPALSKLRLLFTNNQRREEMRGMKSGKIDARVLGRRAPLGDERIFKKRRLPGKKDYFVLIGMDVSGSTSGEVLARIKTAVFAKAELLNRLGVPFAVYAHAGGGADDGGAQVCLMEVKSLHAIWDKKAIQALTDLDAYGGNLDGHTLEFYRKRAQESSAEKRMILYYTDGAMPAANYDEELEILQREIEICKKQGISLVGVGVGTDSPTRHGLDTIRLDSMEDIPLVVDELRKRIN